MKKLTNLLVVLFLVASCASDKKANVEVKISGASDSTEVVVAKLSINQMVVVDTLYVKGEKVSYSAPCVAGCPDFYYFLNNDKKVVSLVLQEGDQIKVVADLDGNVSSIEGSEESKKFSAMDQQFDKTFAKFNSLVKQIDQLQGVKNSAAKQKELNRELNSVYVNHKKEAIKYLYTNSKSISVIPVMYQRLGSELMVFGDINDVYLFKNVYDSLRTVYPASPYVASLADDITRRESMIGLNKKIEAVSEMNYPDISLYDQNAKARNLSELDGKVIILSFWSITEPTHNVFNAELKEIYEKYHSKGLEIYQVSVDMDKTAWARQVKDQGIEWVSVCDPGNLYQTLSLYNIQSLPALFVIDKKGNIVEKNEFDSAKLERTISKLVR